MKAGLTLGELAVRFGCELRGDPDLRVTRVSSLLDATTDAISFLANPKYAPQLASTRAGAVIVDAKSAANCTLPVLIARNPHAVFARVATALHAPAHPGGGIHPSAVVDASAKIDASAAIGPTAVIGANARIGARAIVGPGCVVMHDATIGDDTHLVARVTVCHDVQIGQRCYMHPGAVLGSDGFGNANDGGVWLKVPQLGGLRIGDDVEIGANTTIDRGALGDTVIDNGVKLDNQVHIAHNVHVGAHTAMAAQVGIAGSARIGKHCMLAGKVGVAGQIEICDGVVLMGRATVGASITQPGSYSGALGLEPSRQFRRNAARFRQLDTMAKQLQEVRARLGLKDDNDLEDDRSE